MSTFILFKPKLLNIPPYSRIHQETYYNAEFLNDPASSWYQSPNQHYERLDYCNKARDTMKKVHVEVPYLAGTIDAYVFSDWLASLESYFEGYDMSNESRVNFAIMKFIGQA